MWSKPLLYRFQQPGKVPQTQAVQGFAAFCSDPSRIQPRHSQTRRDTNFAIPGYLLFSMIPRRGVKIKFFLSVVIPVVKGDFVPLSAIGENPANAGVARLCGVSPYPVPDTDTALPNVARYQLRHTRIGEGVRRPITDGVPLLYQIFSGLARGKSAVQSGLQSRHTVGSLPAHAQILSLIHI